MGSNLRIAPANLADSMRVRLQRLYPKAKLVASGDALVVPLPQDADDTNLIAWVRQLLDALWPLPAAKESETAPA